MLSVEQRARFVIGFVALLAGCRQEPPPPPAPAPGPAPPPPATKLAGAPARVMSVRFASDGASVLVLERRAPKDEEATGTGTFAISRRPAGGGAGKELFASSDVLLEMAPLGDAVVAMQRPSTATDRGEARADDEEPDDRLERAIESIEKTALYRIGDGGAPVRISPEGRRCVGLVGAAGGQWVAYSLAPDDKREAYWRRLDPGNEETRVLGAKPGEEITLSVRGLVRDISPDGARVLIRRSDEVLEGGKRPNHRPVPPERVDTKALVLVTVKDQVATALPASIQVDGSAVDTGALFPSFAGDGLVFRSAQGHLYRSALDGSNAQRLAGPLHEADAGAPGGATPDAGAPVERERRILGPKGTLFVLREEADGVVLSSLAKPGAPEAIARFEGPLSALAEVRMDGAEARVALAALSDTSRDGVFEAKHDDGEVFLVGLGPAGAGPISFGRAAVRLLGDELRPRIAAATEVAEPVVTVAPWHGSVKATVTLPWFEDSDAASIFAQVLVAARNIKRAVPEKKVALAVRVGELELDVYESPPGTSPRYLILSGQGLYMPDGMAFPLVHRNPVGLAAGTTKTLTGELENTGKDPTPPIEVYVVMTSGSGADTKRTEVKKALGVIAPGQRVKYTLTAVDPEYQGGVHARFRAEGRRVEVLNTYVEQHALDALATTLDARTRHGVWIEHGEARYSVLNFIVRLSAAQAALADGPREALFRAVAARVGEHHQKFHKRVSFGDRLVFAAPGGGGWKLQGKKIERFEGAPEPQTREALEKASP